MKNFFYKNLELHIIDSLCFEYHRRNRNHLKGMLCLFLLNLFLLVNSDLRAQTTVYDIKNIRYCDNSNASFGSFLSLWVEGASIGNSSTSIFQSYSVESGSFIENKTTGTATLSGRIKSNYFTNVAYYFNIDLSGYTTIASPHFEPNSCVRVTKPDWRYYSNFSGRLRGAVGTEVEGASFSIKPYEGGFSKFQVGTGAAMFNIDDLGMSAWLDIGIFEPDAVQPITGKIISFDQSITNGVDFYFNIEPSITNDFIVKAKIFLEGMLDANTGLMKTDYVSKALLPKAQPFNQSPFNYTGIENVSTFNSNISDWVLLVARRSDGTILSKKPALLRNDGVLLNLNQTEGISMGVLTGDVYVSVHHKSHIAVMSSVPVSHDVLYDFSISKSQARGTEQQKQISSKWCVFAGDFDHNGLNNNLDFNAWKLKGARFNQYLDVDADGNGIVNNLDFNLWARNRSKVGILEVRGL